MAHKRIDLGGSPASSSTSGTRGGSRGSGGGEDKKKNLILLSIAGVAFAIAGYFIYSSFFAVPPAPEESSPEVEQAFDNAVQPPPPADSQPMNFEPGSGKRSYP